MATATWRGISGSWTNPLSWQGFQAPGSADTATFLAGDTSTATLDMPQAIGAVLLAPGTGATLLVQNSLILGGALAVDAGTLELAAGGTIEGGTVSVAGGTVIAAGGVADGVVWLGATGDGLAITAATAAATQAATGQPIAVQGALTLEGGAYTAAFTAETFATGSATLVAAAGAPVVLGGAASITASADDPAHTAGVIPVATGLTLDGPGGFVNDGSIVSDLSLAPLALASASFANAGTITLNTSTVPDQQQVFLVTQGHIQVPVTLTFDEILAPALAIAAAAFANSGVIRGEAATVDVTGAAFSNTGTISLGDAAAEIPVQTATSAYLAGVTLESTFDVAASVTAFSNAGTIAAGAVVFDDNLALAQLGTVLGAVTFAGTVDLGGGTLDVGRLDPGGSMTFTGTVLDGTLIADGGALSTAQATLVGVTVLAQPPGVLLDVTGGSVVLDAATTELAYTTAASIDGLSVTAGAAGVADRIGARAAGTLSFGAGTLISDLVAGSTLEIGGLGTFSDAGLIQLGGSSLSVAAIDGAGTITLSGGASATLDSIAPTSAITVAFGVGDNLLVLPAGASGVNALGLVLTGLQSGDVIDFAAVSSNPPIGAPFGDGGAAVADGMLDVQGASGDQARVALGGDGGAGLSFSVGSDAQGGTIVTVSCFRHGTRIATPAGQRAVQRLRIGDLVLTARGEARPIRWLGRRSYSAELVAAQKQLRPVRFAAGSLGGGLPRRPLYLSPLHAVLLPAPDGGTALVPAAALVDGRRITRAPVEAVSYIHIELDTPDIVLAEGAAAETFVDCASRALFDNAAEYAALYGAQPPAPAAFPAPRVEEGYLLERIRAALPGGRRAAGSGAIRYSLERARDGLIEGWALDTGRPATPVELDLMLDGHPVARLVANRYRIDLDHAGLASDACAFSIALPGLEPHILAALRLRHSASGAVLGG